MVAALQVNASADDTTPAPSEPAANGVAIDVPATDDDEPQLRSGARSASAGAADAAAARERKKLMLIQKMSIRRPRELQEP